MSIFQEGDLRLDFSQASHAQKFDDDNHGMSQCMKAVDFIVEWQGKFLFIEIKDINNPTIRDTRRRKFLNSLKDETLKRNLVKKYTDSFLYQWAAGRFKKPVSVWYIVMIDTPPNTKHELRNTFKENLKQALPLNQPQNWKHSLIDELLVLNLSEWNKYFSQFPVTRLSQSAT